MAGTGSGTGAAAASEDEAVDFEAGVSSGRSSADLDFLEALALVGFAVASIKLEAHRFVDFGVEGAGDAGNNFESSSCLRWRLEVTKNGVCIRTCVHILNFVVSWFRYVLMLYKTVMVVSYTQWPLGKVCFTEI